MDLRVYCREHGVASRATSHAKTTGPGLGTLNKRDGEPDVKGGTGGSWMVTVATRAVVRQVP